MGFPANSRTLLKLSLHYELSSAFKYKKPNFLIVLKHIMKVLSSMCYSTEVFLRNPVNSFGLKNI